MENKRIKDHILQTWGVMTSHKRSIVDKICWKLPSIALVIGAIHEKGVKEVRSHI